MKLAAAPDKNDSKARERRNFSRRRYSGSIFFAARKQLFEGELLNFSPAGLGVKVLQRFVEGENLIVALPYEDTTAAKCLARVVWCNGRGFGAKLIR